MAPSGEYSTIYIFIFFWKTW